MLKKYFKKLIGFCTSTCLVAKTIIRFLLSWLLDTFLIWLVFTPLAIDYPVIPGSKLNEYTMLTRFLPIMAALLAFLWRPLMKNLRAEIKEKLTDVPYDVNDPNLVSWN